MKEKFFETLSTDFVKKVKSKTFQFWNEYSKMVGKLLRFIRAERVGNWDLHLSSVVQMTPYMFAYDHTNYARWMSVYLCDMRLLPSVHPQLIWNLKLEVTL